MVVSIMGKAVKFPPPVQNMFHWRQQHLVTIIIASIAKRRLMRIKMLHLKRGFSPPPLSL
jgi:hypothetical protein